MMQYHGGIHILKFTEVEYSKVEYQNLLQMNTEIY